ncbi:UDP-glucuronosyltransferase 2A1-like isoform X1 [Photinus pyralis]|uniref:UDP-glucuronosyltransferase 2A1-like isoform X1 n=1 Tax=Photinus pyralis TaxID=7054 RepID=UPI001266E6D0|nr:UDP-glucuronosyltransferase 2A1-like isoform X1 [Photinus pyralis]
MMFFPRVMCVLLLVSCMLSMANGARILGIAPIPMYSHQLVFRTLWKGLSLKGHQVTVLTTHPSGDPALTEIDLNVPHRLLHVINSSTSTPELIRQFNREMIRIVDEQLGSAPVRELIADPSASFDLVIAEYYYTGMFAFAERFRCPSIGIISVDGLVPIYKTMGNPTHPVVYPEGIFAMEGQGLMERVASVVAYFVSIYMFHGLHADQQEVVAKHFGGGYPAVAQMASEISLLFVNADPVFHQVRPLVPAVVQIGGGFQRAPAKPLPKELKAALDAARQGFIYFSLGSSVRNEFLPPDSLKAIMKTFGELPFVVLWKFDRDDLPGKPENVMVSQWVPQQDVLRHPNIKLFITQGGLQSMDEAIYEHVPMVGIPFYGDQPFNVKKMVRKGFGLELDYRTLNKEQFKAAVLEVINNPKYKSTLKYLAELAQDQPMTGLEKAVWWSEYVIRHKGAKHLRSPLLDIPWYQYLLLDVIGIIVVTVAVALYLIYFLLKSLVRLVKYIFRSKPKRKQKKN